MVVVCLRCLLLVECLNVSLTARIWWLPGGLGRPNCSGFLFTVEPRLPDQTVSKLFEALFVVLDVLLFASFLSSSFDIVFYLLSEPLGVDFELPN